MTFTRNPGPCVMAILCVTATMISSCASFREPGNEFGLRPIPRDSVVHIVGNETDLEAPDAKSAEEIVYIGAVKGASLGVGMGAGFGFLAGLVCGPAFVVCSSVGAAGGATSGLIVGALSGGVGTAMVALPKEKAEALESGMTAVLMDLGASTALQNQFKAQSVGFLTEGDAGAGIEIRLGVEEVGVEQATGDELHIKLVNSMVITYGPDDQDKTKRLLFTYVSNQHHVDHWIKGNGVNLHTEIHTGLEYNIQNMVKVLQQSNRR